MRAEGQQQQAAPETTPDARKPDVHKEVSTPTADYHKGADAEDALAASPSVVKEEVYAYKWTIEDFGKFSRNYDAKSNPSPSIRSESWKMGEYEWDIYLFPMGNNTPGYLSVYAEIVQKDYPANWSQYARVKFVLHNKDPAKDKIDESGTTFSDRCHDWGYTRFFKLSDLTEENGFLTNGALVFEVVITYCEDPAVRRSRWDSRKETGMVGLLNQGATCYMNSLLQAMFNISSLRKSVYDMNVENGDTDKNVPLALQRVFYGLQFSLKAVDTKPLLDSFGWDAHESFVQHDVQEFYRVLVDKLEEKMKGTHVDGAIGNLFVGKIKNYIDCTNVSFKSEREEKFYDISLQVKGCKNIIESFEKYVEVETLEGDNRYRAEGFGLQEAKKGLTFLSFPPVLNLHMKRFEYDWVQDMQQKINDYCEFPEELDLSKFLSPDAAPQGRAVYRLWSVLVHCGDVHGGHYYSFVRNPKDMKWYRCDDDRVEPATEEEAINDNYGISMKDAVPWTKKTKMANAYYLIYVKIDSEPNITYDLKKEAIPESVRNRFEEEWSTETKHKTDAEKRKKDDENSNVLWLWTTSELVDHHGVDLGLVVRPGKPRRLKIPKVCNCNEVYDVVANYLSVSVQQLALFNCIKRVNSTVRPEDIIPNDANVKLTPAAFSKLDGYTSGLGVLALPMQASFKKWFKDREKDRAHEASGKDLICTVAQPSTYHCLLFIKHFDPNIDNNDRMAKLRYCGFIHIAHQRPSDGCLNDNLQEIAKICDIPKKKLASYAIYEEVKPDMINLCDTSHNYKDLELTTGDILVFQPPGAKKENALKEYYDHLRSFTDIEFKDHNRKGEDGVCLQLPAKLMYTDAVKALASVIKCDYKHIKLHSSITYVSVNRSLAQKDLSEFVSHTARGNIVYYEILNDMTFMDLENMKTVSVVWVDEQNYEKKTYSLPVLKNGHVTDIMDALMKKIGGTTTSTACIPTVKVGDDIRYVRLIEMRQRNRFYRVLRGPEYIRSEWESVRDNSSLIAGYVPADELDWWLGPGIRAADIKPCSWWMGHDASTDIEEKMADLSVKSPSDSPATKESGVGYYNEKQAVDSCAVMDEKERKANVRLFEPYGIPIANKKLLWIHHTEASQDEYCNLFGYPLSIVVNTEQTVQQVKELIRPRAGMDDRPVEYSSNWTLVVLNFMDHKSRSIPDGTVMYDISCEQDEVIALKHKNMRSRVTHSMKYKERAVVINA